MEGVCFLVGDPILRAFLATAFTAQFFYSAIMAIYVLYLTRELGLSPVAIGIVFGLGGGAGVLIGSAAASAIVRAFGVGRTLVATHLLFGLLGAPLALATVLPSLAAPLVFASEFAQLSVNAVYMVNRVSVEQAVTPSRLRGRVQRREPSPTRFRGLWGPSWVASSRSKLASAHRLLLALLAVNSRLSGCSARPPPSPRASRSHALERHAARRWLGTRSAQALVGLAADKLREPLTPIFEPGQPGIECGNPQTGGPGHLTRVS